MHPDFTRRVRLVMWWNRFVFDHPPLSTKLGWDLTTRESGCVFKKSERQKAKERAAREPAFDEEGK